MKRKTKRQINCSLEQSFLSFCLDQEKKPAETESLQCASKSVDNEGSTNKEYMMKPRVGLRFKASFLIPCKRLIETCF